MRPGAVLTACVAAAAAQPALATPRAEALAGAFSRWCLARAPDLGAIDTAARAAGLEVESDERTVDPAGAPLETKVWRVSREETGAFAVTAGDAVKNGRRVSICGVAAPDAVGQDLLATLSSPGRLGSPTGEQVSDDGVQHIYQFNAPFAGAAILLAGAEPPTNPGVMLNIIQIRESVR